MCRKNDRTVVCGIVKIINGKIKNNGRDDGKQ